MLRLIWVVFFMRGITSATSDDDGDGDGVGKRPTSIVEVRDFYMSKTEVTVEQYRKCVEAGECSEPNNKNDYPKCNRGYSDRDDHPIKCVDWYQARAFHKDFVTWGGVGMGARSISL